MAAIDGYISAECSKVSTDKWTFSIEPKIVPADKARPYEMYDHSKSGANLVISPKGGKQVKFRLSVPQLYMVYDATMEALKNAPMEKHRWNNSKSLYEKTEKLYYYDLSKACGDDYLMRIFGKEDEKGLCMARKLVLTRNPVTQDRRGGGETLANQPWNICITTGKGVKVVNETGGQYMKSGTFVEDNKSFVRLSDGSMATLFVPAKQAIDIFIDGTRNSVFDGYARLSKQAMDRRNASDF